MCRCIWKWNKQNYGEIEKKNRARRNNGGRTLHIRKTDNHQKSANYRKSSYCQLKVKFFKKNCCQQLKVCLNKNALLQKEKCADRPHNSAEDALVFAVNNILLDENGDLFTGLVFVNLCKEIDRVQHQRLIDELVRTGVVMHCHGSWIIWVEGTGAFASEKTCKYNIANTSRYC